MTPSEIKEEMLKVKVPWFVGFAEKFWFKFGRYFLPVGILAYVPMGIIYNKLPLYKADIMWDWMIYWFLFLMFGIGGLMLISHLVEKSFVKKQANRLGISIWQWNAYAKELGLKSYKD